MPVAQHALVDNNSVRHAQWHMRKATPPKVLGVSLEQDLNRSSVVCMHVLSRAAGLPESA